MRLTAHKISHKEGPHPFLAYQENQRHQLAQGRLRNAHSSHDIHRSEQLYIGPVIRQSRLMPPS